MTKVSNDVETERQLNDYNEFAEAFIEHFTTNFYNQGVLTDVTPEDLQKYFANPDTHVSLLSNLTEYFYISTGEIHMLFELIEALPSLNYRIEAFEKPKAHEKNLLQINKKLHKVKHATLTRDILKQTAADGTLTGIWLGEKTKLFPYIFDNPVMAFPSYRRNGDWVVQYDLSHLDKLKDYGREIVFSNLSPYITKEKYDNYKASQSRETKYVELPQDRTFVIRTHTLKRNQALGTGWANSALFDVLHKRKLKNVEQAIANKIINGIAVLTIGSEKSPETSSLKLNKNAKKKIQLGVKTALTKSQSEGVPVVALPEFAKLDFPDIKTDGLDGKKFDHVNADIDSSIGISGAVTNGDGGNNASGKINLDVLYKRIGVLLSTVETEMYQKMINLLLPTSQEDNYQIVYDKNQPLTQKERVDALFKMLEKGFSVKYVIDNIDGVQWQSYLDQTIYETEELKLQERIKPFLQSSVISGNDNGSNAKDEGDLTPEGQATRDGAKNDQ